MPRRPPPLRRYAPHLLVATTAIVVFVVASDLFPYHSANHDEGVYLQQAAMLLDGQLTLHPPVADAFRPWFFVEDGTRLYPKYAPVSAAVFAIPLALGIPRLALALVGATIVALTFAITAHIFDRRTGLVAGGLLLTSPLFVLDTATFLPYAPTTAFNLVFAYAYLQAETTTRHQHRWAALAGGAIGLAFFSRPYTAVLFATPFIAHAGWSLWHEDADTGLTRLRGRRLVTALAGLLGVLMTLAYNWQLTGDPFVFPYQAFAPLDGLGFGHRELLDHSLQYTPELALRVNGRVLHAYLTEWAPLGVLGSGLAVLGVILSRRNWDWQRAVLLGVFPAVALGNVYFWGNYNILGNVAVPGDGLIAILGPYYHFDLLLPTAVFAAHGLVTLSTRARTIIDSIVESRAPDAMLSATQIRAVAVAGLLVVVGVVGGASTVGAFDAPVERNTGVTAEYEAAYQPFIDGEGPPTDAVVFLPATYGSWLNHPFQHLRNPPDYQTGPVYALPENEFAVVDTYPDRQYYRYAYRGNWNPFDGTAVTPTLQPVTRVSGPHIVVDAAFELPDGTTSTSIRLSTETGHAYYATDTSTTSPGSTQQVFLHVNGSRAWVSGPGLTPTGNGPVPVGGRADVVVVVNVNTEGGGFTYRLVLPVSQTPTGERRALTPEQEVCTVPQFCGGAAAYVPGPGGSNFTMNVTLRRA